MWPRGVRLAHGCPAKRGCWPTLPSPNVTDEEARPRARSQPDGRLLPVLLVPVVCSTSCPDVTQQVDSNRFTMPRHGLYRPCRMNVSRSAMCTFWQQRNKTLPVEWPAQCMANKPTCSLQSFPFGFFLLGLSSADSPAARHRRRPKPSLPYALQSPSNGSRKAGG